MADPVPDGRPFPPGEYPLIVIGSSHRSGVGRVLAGTTAERLLHLFALMPHAEHHVAQIVAAKQFHLMFGERAARDLEQHLGDALRQRLHPRGQTSGEYDDRQAHEKRTFVPSKSNRIRTSSMPALRMAARNRERSSA